MTQLRPLGLMLGLAGNIMLGLAIYKLISGGECGDYGQPVCSEETMWYGLLLPLGITLSIAACFLGGGWLSFCGTFLAIGFGAMASAAFNPLPGMESFGWWFGGMFVFFGLAPLLLIPFAIGAARKQARQLGLLKTGRKGIGTVVRVRDTGMTINDDPRVEIVVRVEPGGGGAVFERSKRAVVPRVAIPRVGDRFPVWFDPADPDNWFMVTEIEPHAPDEIKRLFAEARRTADTGASPIEDLERLDALRRSGALTEAEFAVAKSRLLGLD